MIALAIFILSVCFVVGIGYEIFENRKLRSMAKDVASRKR